MDNLLKTCIHVKKLIKFFLKMVYLNNGLQH